jgi:hypothetical protein
MSTAVKAHLKVADEVWLAVAQLHRQQPDRLDFSIEEIMACALSQNLDGFIRPGVYVHVVQHCVANRPPNPGRYRMLFETAAKRRRLFRKGDPFHPDRNGGKIAPVRDEIPQEYEESLAWYQDWSVRFSRDLAKNDPLLALRGSGKHLWSDEHADDYIRRLREGWE